MEDDLSARLAISRPVGQRRLLLALFAVVVLAQMSIGVIPTRVLRASARTRQTNTFRGDASGLGLRSGVLLGHGSVFLSDDMLFQHTLMKWMDL